MAHIQTQYGGLWKPQDLTLDKISSQKMFVDNIDSMESFIKEGKQKVHPSVKTIADLKAIDTSDTALFTTGMLIMVHEVGIFCFNRNTTDGASTDSDDIIVPTTGGGEWISTNINSAPAGYGLGEIDTKLAPNRDANAITETGFYKCSVNMPDTEWWYGFHINYGKNSSGKNYAYQEFMRSENDKRVCRQQISDVWGEWEWINPPMVLNTEYRTTERINGKAVYKKNVNGVIQYHLDGEIDWKPYTDAVGAYSKTETDKLLQKKVNPNLLDNWYFANPVNQRGKTEYTESGYTFDRWLLIQWNATRVACSIVTKGLRVRGEASGPCSTSIKQFVEGIKAGCQVTASVLVTDFTVGSAVHLFIRTNSGVRSGHVHFSKPGLYSVTTTLPDDFDGNLMIEIGQGGSDGGNRNTDFTVLAVKLELGTEQTLAHQDENGNWVLNEIPNYHEEFLKCIQSTADPTDEYANKVIYHTGNKPTPADIGAAPAGYGIGEEAATRVNNVDIDTLKKGGTYYIGTGCTNTPPNTDDAWSTLHVIPGRSCTQIYIPANNPNLAGTHSSWIARIYNDKTNAWGPWEWVNPPMQLGVEYRTTERYLGKSVYVKAVDFGNSVAGGDITVTDWLPGSRKILRIMGSVCTSNNWGVGNNMSVIPAFPYGIPSSSNIWDIYVKQADSNKATVYTGSSHVGRKVIMTVWYTKN